MTNDDRIHAVWLQCLQAATSMQMTFIKDAIDRQESAAIQVAKMADYLYQQYDSRFGLKYAEDGSGRVVKK
jgi:hypothetical protein